MLCYVAGSPLTEGAVSTREICRAISSIAAAQREYNRIVQRRNAMDRALIDKLIGMLRGRLEGYMSNPFLPRRGPAPRARRG